MSLSKIINNIPDGGEYILTFRKKGEQVTVMAVRKTQGGVVPPLVITGTASEVEEALNTNLHVYNVVTKPLVMASKSLDGAECAAAKKTAEAKVEKETAATAGKESVKKAVGKTSEPKVEKPMPSNEEKPAGKAKEPVKAPSLFG